MRAIIQHLDKTDKDKEESKRRRSYDYNEKRWTPSAEFLLFMEQARKNSVEAILSEEPKFSDDWLSENLDTILTGFACGYSAKAVSASFGITWSTWRNWIMDYPQFRKANEFGESMQLMVMEQIRNEHARGELRGNTAAALAAIDRLHSDVYFGKPGMVKESGHLLDSDMDLSEAMAVLDEAGVELDAL